MLLFIIAKYLTALIIIMISLIAEMDAITFNFNILSFNNNKAGDNSLNGNANAASSNSNPAKPAKNKDDAHDATQYDDNYYDEVTSTTQKSSIVLSISSIFNIPFLGKVGLSFPLHIGYLGLIKTKKENNQYSKEPYTQSKTPTVIYIGGPYSYSRTPYTYGGTPYGYGRTSYGYSVVPYMYGGVLSYGYSGTPSYYNSRQYNPSQYSVYYG